MADIFSKKKRSEIMSKIKGKETKLEIAFRKELWRSGYRYRKNVSGYFGKPDILLKKYKTVIFTDSCFWHGCKKHFRLPSSKVDYWTNKISRNKKRDKKVDSYYKKNGWNIIRVWEHDRKNIPKIVEKLKNNLSKDESNNLS